MQLEASGFPRLFANHIRNGAVWHTHVLREPDWLCRIFIPPIDILVPLSLQEPVEQNQTDGRTLFLMKAAATS